MIKEKLENMAMKVNPKVMEFGALAIMMGGYIAGNCEFINTGMAAYQSVQETYGIRRKK